MESDVHLNTSVLRTVLRAVIIAASVLAIIILCALIFLQLNADSLVAGYRDRLAEETGCGIELIQDLGQGSGTPVPASIYLSEGL